MADTCIPGSDPLEISSAIHKLITSPHDKDEVIDLQLSPEKRRWLVFGITLNNTIAPCLRQYVDPIVKRAFSNLTSAQLHRMTSYKNKQSLEYRNINNNALVQWNKQQHVHKLQNHVDFSKLFLRFGMAKYTAFDETCDPSALLNLIIQMDDFPSIVRPIADTIRMFRNDWGHCDFTNWTESYYLDAFANMEKFIRSLQLSPSEKEKKILSELTKWQNDGIRFFSTPWVDAKLCEKIQYEVKTLA
ncbi:unnamed protein product, partial [Owenia fusiformis]